MAGIHRSSTLTTPGLERSLPLGMAGIHRSSTLHSHSVIASNWLGMAGIHRSSTLEIPRPRSAARARDGRDSPLKYTEDGCRLLEIGARDGRDSPLKYTSIGGRSRFQRLGMAGIHRSSTLYPWGGNIDQQARDGRDSPLKYTDERPRSYSVSARDGRDSPLKYTFLPSR